MKNNEAMIITVVQNISWVDLILKINRFSDFQKIKHQFHLMKSVIQRKFNHKNWGYSSEAGEQRLL